MGAGGQQYVGLQDYEVEALKGLPLIFVHNHPNDTGASDEDLRSAYDAGAKLLIVITRDGREQVYIRGRGRMVLVRDEQASYEVGSPTLDETIELAMKSAKQVAAYLDDSPELVFLQDQQGLDVELSGSMSYVYDQRGRHLIHDSFDDSVTHQVLGKSQYNPYIVSIKLHIGEVITVDLQNLDDDVSISGLDLADLPTINADHYPSPTAEEVLRSFQKSPLGTWETFPIAQDPWETEIYQFADRHPRYTNTPENRHPGLDMFAPAGTEVIAPSEGEVIAIYIPSGTDFEYDAYGEIPDDGKGIMIDPRQLYPDIPAGHTQTRKNIVSGMLTPDAEGAYIVIRFDNTFAVFAHLDPSSIQVGMHVKAGQVIGRIGGDHLHLETRIHGANPVYIDSETGDYIRNPDPQNEDDFAKPLVAVNPIWYFNERMTNAINYGLELRDKNVWQRGGNEQYNASTDARTQNTHVIDLGAWRLHTNKVTAAIELQFNPDADWLDMTHVIVE